VNNKRALTARREKVSKGKKAEMLVWEKGRRNEGKNEPGEADRKGKADKGKNIKIEKSEEGYWEKDWWTKGTNRTTRAEREKTNPKRCRRVKVHG